MMMLAVEALPVDHSRQRRGGGCCTCKTYIYYLQFVSGAANQVTSFIPAALQFQKTSITIVFLLYSKYIECNTRFHVRNSKICFYLALNQIPVCRLKCATRQIFSTVRTYQVSYFSKSILRNDRSSTKVKYKISFKKQWDTSWMNLQKLPTFRSQYTHFSAVEIIFRNKMCHKLRVTFRTVADSSVR